MRHSSLHRCHVRSICIQHRAALFINIARHVHIMLMHYLPLLNSHRLVLASASPRRKELLAQIGLRIEVQASSFEEDLDKGKYSPAGYAQATAQQKALDVDRRTRDDAVRPLLIIAADTVPC